MEEQIIGQNQCGPACLKHVLEMFGQFFTLEELATECGTTTAGTTAAQIVAAAQAKGLNATAHARTFGLLGQNTSKPAIIHWGGNHFVVLKDVDFDKKTAIVFNPLIRQTTIHTMILQHYYSGVVIEFEQQ